MLLIISHKAIILIWTILVYLMMRIFLVHCSYEYLNYFELECFGFDAEDFQRLIYKNLWGLSFML